MTMVREDAKHVRIRYQPLSNRAVVYAGADFSSDGQTLSISLKACSLMVNTPCPVQVPSVLAEEAPIANWYEVVIPYQGEAKVMVSPDGDEAVELSFAEAAPAPTQKPKPSPTAQPERWRIKLVRAGDGQLRILYRELQATMYYSPGVNHRTDGQTLFVELPRCYYKKRCDVQVPFRQGSMDGVQHLEADIPWQGEPVELTEDGKPVLGLRISD
ncbi:hypothetical protein [Hydrogenophaga sp. 5NK40-0174]|uniref:hypothetical protein n=1 Tax=Hydrogenophaga sp. 5NK40-0174 TaxID=3127649 RepID=UPI0031058461